MAALQRPGVLELERHRLLDRRQEPRRTFSDDERRHDEAQLVDEPGREQGAHEALNHRDPGYTDRILPLTGNAGVNVVLEMLANVNLDRDLELLAFRWRVVVIGSRGRVEIDPRKTMGKDAAILGMTLFIATRDEFVEIHAGVRAGLENGTLSPSVSGTSWRSSGWRTVSP